MLTVIKRKPPSFKGFGGNGAFAAVLPLRHKYCQLCSLTLLARLSCPSISLACLPGASAGVNMTTLEQIETRAAKVASVLRRLGRGACPRKQAERADQALHDCWETESRRPISEKTQLSMLVYEQYRAIELPSFRGSEPYASRVAEHSSAPVNIASAYCERLQLRPRNPRLRVKLNSRLSVLSRSPASMVVRGKPSWLKCGQN